MKEYSILNILKAKKSNDVKTLNEISLGRVYQHYKQSSEKGFGIITSWRAGNTKKQNLKNLKKLESDIRSMGYGFSKLEGHWVECQDEDIPYDQCPKDKLVASVEPSLFVIGINKDEIEKLTKKYHQDASVYAGPETNGKVILIFSNGNTMNIGKFHPSKIAQAYSKLRGKTFTFEGFEYKSQSWIEKLIEMKYKDMLKT